MFSKKPLTIPSKADALPGRAERMPVPDAHFVNGHRISPPFPDGLARAVFGMGCFWGAEKKFWQLPRRLQHGGRLRRRPDAEPDLSRSLHRHDRPQRSGARRVRSQDRSATTTLLKVFWENHDPTQGMRQGNDVGTQYRSGIYYDDADQQRAAEASRDAFQQQLAAAGYGAITTEIRPGAGVLLRRGLPPAVPGEEPRRLLRPRRHRRELPDRGRDDRVITAWNAERAKLAKPDCSCVLCGLAFLVCATHAQTPAATSTATFAAGCFSEDAQHREAGRTALRPLRAPRFPA